MNFIEWKETARQIETSRSTKFKKLKGMKLEPVSIYMLELGTVSLRYHNDSLQVSPKP
jgi:hypothetical protein